MLNLGKSRHLLRLLDRQDAHDGLVEGLLEGFVLTECVKLHVGFALGEHGLVDEGFEGEAAVLGIGECK